MPEDCIAVVPNGISGSDLGLEESPEPASFEPLRFLFVGRLVEQKGADLALRAFHACQENFRERGVPAALQIVGDGPQRPALEQLARQLGMRNVDFVGAVAPASIGGRLAGASIVLMPSRAAEGFGRVAAEAALARRTVIATSVAGLAEVVVDRQTGVLVEPGSVEALASAMRSLSSNLPLVLELATRAHDRARSQYTLAACARRYDHLYRTMIEETA